MCAGRSLDRLKDCLLELGGIIVQLDDSTSNDDVANLVDAAHYLSREIDTLSRDDLSYSDDGALL